MLITLIVGNLEVWTLVCPLRSLVYPAPENNKALILKYLTDPLKALSDNFTLLLQA